LKTTQKKKKPDKKKKRHPKSIARRNLKNSLRFLPVGILLIVTAFIYTWQHTRLTIVGLPIEPLRTKKRDLIKQNDSIRLRIEQLQAPARIESIARNKLGMVSPQKWQVVALNEPTQPPEAAPETNRLAEHRPPSTKKSAGLFGFLKKHGNLGNTSQEYTPPETTGQSG
jgi:cell division protein FtsL